MNKVLTIFVILFFALSGIAQKTFEDSLAGFDNIHFKEHLNNISDKSEIKSRLEIAQRNFIRSKYYPLPAKTFPLSTSSSTCGNFDFEDGNANGWTIAGDYKIMSGTAVDTFGGFPVVCPGGNFSLRLNDNNTNATSCSPPGTKNTFTSTATRSLTITSGNSMVKVNFAACFLAFPHSQIDAANLRIEFFDALNNPLAVPTFTTKYINPGGGLVSSMPTANSTTTIQGLQICGYGTYDVAYLPWQQKQFNLSAYIGQTIQIKLTAAWCLYQYDWGYAYFDVCCDNACAYVGPTSQTKNYYVCTTTPFSMNACTNNPFNINYQWYDSSGPISTASCIPVSAYGDYTLTSVHPASPTFTMNEIFTYTNAAAISFSLPPTSCKSVPITLSATPSGGTFSGPGVFGNTFNPGTVGTKTITYTFTNTAGCSSSVTRTTNVVVCTTNIGSVENDQKFTVAPNPFKDQISIESKNLPENRMFVLFNTIGQEVLRKRLSDGKNTIETEGIPQGLYIYSLEHQNKPIKQGKLVKD